MIEELHAKWRDMIGQVQNALSDLLQQRRWAERLGRMFHDNKNFFWSESPFAHDLVRWYTAFALMAVRRQTDSGSKVVSLRRLLEQMKNNPPALVNASPVNHKLTVAEIDADISKLESVSEKIVRVADKEIAHAERGGFGDEAQRPKIKELDDCVDEFAEIAKKYVLILTGAAMPSLVPTEQFDAEDIFCFPWVPKCAKCNHSANYHADELGGTCNGMAQDFHLTKHMQNPPPLEGCECTLTEAAVYEQTSRAGQ